MIGSALLVMLASMSYTSIEALIGNMSSNRARFAQDYALESAAFVTQRPLADSSSLAARFDVVLEARREADVVMEGTEPYTLRVLEQTSLVNRPAVIDGTPLAAESELLLGQTIALSRKTPVGSTIAVAGRTFDIVGLVTLPDYLYPLKDTEETSLLIDMKAFGIAVVTGAAMDALDAPTHTVWHVRGAAKDLVALRYAVTASSGLANWLDIGTNPRYVIVDGEIRNARFAVASIPTLLLVLASFMLAIAMNRFVHRELPQIGMLLAQGYTAGELVRHYLSLPAAVAAVGSTLGVVLGFLSFRPLYYFYTLFFAIPLLHLDMRASWILVSVFLPFAFLLPSVALVAVRAVRRTPVDLMKNRGERMQVTALERRLRIRRLSVASQFRMRDVVRSPGRLAVTLIGIAAAAAMLLAGQTLQHSITIMIDTTFNHIMRYEYQYVLRTPCLANPWGGETAYVEPFRGTDADSLGLQVIGVDPAFTMIQAQDTSGAALSFDRVVMTRPLADRWGVSPGDTVTVVRMATDKSYTLTVDAVAEIYTNSAIFIPRDELGTLLNVPKGAFNVIYSVDALAITGADVISTSTRSEMLQGFESTMTWLRAMMNILGAMGILIALFVVLVVASLSVEDHRITISTLKVLGYANREIAGMVLLSTVIPVVLGYAVAVPLLARYLRTLLALNQQSLDFTLPIRVSPLGVGVGFLIIAASWGVATLLAMRTVFKVPLAESLKAARE
jgi:putative ABC transport system permease protein